MTRSEIYEAFARRLTELMVRAGLSELELGRRLGVSRQTIRRWKSGRVQPHERHLEPLGYALRWRAADGRIRELDESEMSWLRTAAGYSTAIVSQSIPDFADTADRCIMYSYRYARHAFPAQWSLRVIEVERTLPGTTLTMWDGLPSITRPAEFYNRSYERGLYDQHLIVAYMKAHESRQARFFQRLREAPVRHIYGVGQTEAYCACKLTSPRFRGTAYGLIRRQIGNIIKWLEDYRNFEVGLTGRTIPGNVIVVGTNLVLLQPEHTFTLLTGYNVMGLEIVGPHTAAKFIDQFDAIWGSQDTTRERSEVITYFRNMLRELPDR